VSESGTAAPGTAPWRQAEASRLIEFGRAAALPDGGFGWLDVNGDIDLRQPRPLYINARMTYVFALAHLAGVAGADALAASGISALAGRYADGANGGWFSSLDSSGNVLDATKANYAHAHVLLAAASALAAGIPGAGAALEAAAAAIDRHFWSDAEGRARESWNADFTEPEPYRGANSNMHSVEAYLAAGDVTGQPVWHARAASIAGHLVNVHGRAHAWRIPEHYDENWQHLPDYNADRPSDPFRPPGTTPGHSLECPAAADAGGGSAGAVRLAARGGDRAVRYRGRRRLAAGRPSGPDLHRRRGRPAGGDGTHALGGLRGRARR
jgi:sulfoquinovose isomerase